MPLDTQMNNALNISQLTTSQDYLKVIQMMQSDEEKMTPHSVIDKPHFKTA